MKRLLLIVDPQVDFIAGTLPVPGAEEAMDRLAEYIYESDGRYAHKIVTADRHPYDHFSFDGHGGPWPRHCVHDTVGAAVWQHLFAPLYSTSGSVTFLYKGENRDEEEYSIFKNRCAAERIRRIVEDEEIGRIDICGLAGDVCVRSTLTDGVGIFGKNMFHVLTSFSPSLDGGEALAKAIAKLQVTCDR